MSLLLVCDCVYICCIDSISTSASDDTLVFELHQFLALFFSTQHMDTLSCIFVEYYILIRPTLYTLQLLAAGNSKVGSSAPELGHLQ